MRNTKTPHVPKYHASCYLTTPALTRPCEARPGSDRSALWWCNEHCRTCVITILRQMYQINAYWKILTEPNIKSNGMEIKKYIYFFGSLENIIIKLSTTLNGI